MTISCVDVAARTGGLERLRDRRERPEDPFGDPQPTQTAQ
jgi:hypothetical protein